MQRGRERTINRRIPSGRNLSHAVIGLGLLVAACRKPHATRAAPEARAALSEQLLAGPNAFALIATADGARLVYSPRERSAGAVMIAAIDRNGQERGAREPLLAAAQSKGEVVDIAGAWANSGLSVAWLERARGEARVRAAQALAPSKFSLLDLGSMGSEGARGDLGLGVQDGAALLLSRSQNTPCVDGSADSCVGFAFQRLRDGKVASAGLALSVPAPCPENAIELTVGEKSLHYAVCSLKDGKPTTTLFTIRSEPAYARADHVLDGCKPLALLSIADSVWFIADCEGRRRAARVGNENAPVEFDDLLSPRVDCRSAPTLVAGALELTLREPRDGIEALLPTSIAARGSRAAWTGNVLLVARAPAGKLELTRYACSGPTLRQLGREVQ